MVIRQMLLNILFLGLLGTQGVVVSMAMLAKRLNATGLSIKPKVVSSAFAQRKFSQLPAPQKPKKIQEVSELIKKHYLANQEQWNNVGVATAVGLGTCLLFPVLPKLIGGYLITRTAYRVVASPIQKEAAKGYLNQLFNRLKK
jgi:glycine cleavage system pyridoxal-binding protein P